MVKLRGLAWDHRRCWGPLDASVPTYCAKHAGLEIEWDRRSLYEFGEGPIDPVLAAYDLVVFDHPFVGEIARGGLTIPFDSHLTTDQRSFFARDSVGPSWQSYAMDGKQWALPIDAACQVASYRPDLMASYGSLPRTHAEVLDLGRRLRANGKWIGLPLVATDATCLLLTLCTPQSGAHEFISRDVLENAVGQIRELRELAHPNSPEWNPIRCYDYMITHHDVVYVPFAFGYVNYASMQDGPHLQFTNIPTRESAGALLGGAGIGVSAKSRHRAAAIDYALFLCSPDYQRGDYVRSGGQPGSLSAWQSEEANAMSRGFFKSTLQTIQSSYLRPTHFGFLAFFREIAPSVAATLAGEKTLPDLHAWINACYSKALARSRADAPRSVA